MDTKLSPQQPIGMFDSGVGGLSVLRAIRSELPNEDVLYLADQAHIPYGSKSKKKIRRFAVEITRFLIDQGAKLIVVACNTASAAALHDLRDRFPSVSFVGMEPAVKPAAETTRTGKVGVLATSTTFAGDLYSSVVERFAKHVTIYKSACPGLVEEIESGGLETPETRKILEEALAPMLEAGIDTVVMGCTHYPFVIPLIEEITGPEVRTIDPAPAIARQAHRLLKVAGLRNPDESVGKMIFYTSGDVQAFANLLPRFMGESGDIHQVGWNDCLHFS
ncbi:MAG: glutamate racemase [Chloroflexota bacterium]|nr:glutamate racemase [Chloroflexota bacterium]